MKILKLEILNLASLDREGGEVIDFEAGTLKDSTIFSIVGPTGSGKSTILDAICLALYERAPRYTRLKKNGKLDTKKIEILGSGEDDERNRLPPTDCRNILSRGKKEGYSKLTFMDNKGDVYRAEWHVKFNRTKYEDNLPPSLYKITTQDGQLVEEVAEWKEIPEIIGLEYDQFLLTVLIAQGAFANFLNADVEDRYKLLEKLIGSEQLYSDIVDKIKAQASAADKAYVGINADYSAYEKDIIENDEELEQLKARIAAWEEEEQKAKEELGRISVDLKWFTDEQTFVTNLGKYLEAQKQAEADVNASKPYFDRLVLHDTALKATAYYKEIHDAAGNIEKHKSDLKQLDEKLKEKQSAIGQAGKDLDALKETEKDATQAFNDQKPHIDSARTLKGELKALNTTMGEKKKEKDRCEREYSEARTAYSGTVNLAGATLDDKLEMAIKCFETESKKNEGVNASLLQQAKSDADRQKTDIGDAIRIQNEMDTKRQKLQDNDKRRSDNTARMAAIADERKKLDIDKLDSELQTLRSTHTLMTSKNWVLQRSHLEEGKPCPLCGATDHPYKSEAVVAPVVNGLQKIIAEKEESLNGQREKQKILGKEQGEIEGTLRELYNSDQTLNNDLERLKNDWAPIHLRHPEWPEDAAALKALQLAIDQKAERASNALTDYNTAAGNVEKLRAIKDRGAALRDATAAYNAAVDKVNAKIAEMKKEIGDKDPDAFEQELNEAKKKATEAVNAQNEAIGKLREDLQSLKGRQTTTQENLGKEQNKHKERTESLSQWLSSYNSEHEPALSENDIADLYAATDNWEQIRSRKEELNNTLTKATTTYNNEVTKHNEHQAKKPAKTQEELTVRKTELEQKKNTELDDAKMRLKKHEEAKEKNGELLGKKQAAERLKDDWKEISDAIGGDGKQLRKIAQCYTLRFLIEHANAEIRKFNSRYELQQVKNSLGIRVIDHDRADDVRDTTSLSGGETFIVSLGLALGLSSLSSRNISFENLFIDEGFGTLDPDTLATVIDSLAMLQSSQGKKVGVISHTNTMSERITTQIRLIPQGNTGSSHIEIVPR